LASEGDTTVLSASARIIARSSSAIWDGPSSPMLTPACEPAINRSLRATVAIRRDVVGAGQERSERREAGSPPRRIQPDGGTDGELLGDVHLEEPIRELIGEVVEPGGVPHLGVEGDDVRSRTPDRGDRLAECVTGGDLVADLPPRQIEAVAGSVGPVVELRGGVGPDPEVTIGAQLGDRRVGIVERLAVLAFGVVGLRDAGTFAGASDHGGRCTGTPCEVECAVDRVDVVAVDDEGVPPERREPPLVRDEVPSVAGLARLAEPVDVDQHGHAGDPPGTCMFDRFPHRAFGEFAVATQHPDMGVDVGEAAVRDRHSDTDRRPEPE
jgi:hypothetical protein